MNSPQIRGELERALRLDLIGPGPGEALEAEALPMPPSRWYLTGFLVPFEATEQRHDPESVEQVDALPAGQGGDDDQTPEPASARKVFLPSSMGLSLLVPQACRQLEVSVDWGDYRKEQRPTGEDEQTQEVWQRVPRHVVVTLPIAEAGVKQSPVDVPESGGLRIVLSVRTVPALVDGRQLLPAGTRSVSVFLVNHRPRADRELADEAFIFQAQLTARPDHPLVARPDLRGTGDDWDERVAHLQYADAVEFAVGHGVATHAQAENGVCRDVRTDWLPRHAVPRVEPFRAPGLELGMEALAGAQHAVELQAVLAPLPRTYSAWLVEQRATAPKGRQEAETAAELSVSANRAAQRIEAGIGSLSDAHVFKAFVLANRAMAAAARRREAQKNGARPEDMKPPEWRTFQLAFLLMNLHGVAEPTHNDRETVDLLFFPTGGGKTEAYLGLAAFTLVLRRLTHPGITSAGLSVLMRYTLRLLTLDQLGRAAALICALELERQKDPENLGEWPFEIGLWVGMKATPNRMGRKGDDDRNSARTKVTAFQRDSSKPSPIPIENCPWCGAKFGKESFRLHPNEKAPSTLRVMCTNLRCDFRGNNPLPIHAVDEPVYRRLPCLLIATVDKFAALPWTGPTGALFGKVSHWDADGFYGPCDSAQGKPIGGPLPPPDLIIQDELHLISGPLGTMVGLYETAIEALCTRRDGGRTIRPKIVASTATIRRAESQIRALFGRAQVDVFPPPGPNRHDSFFSRTATEGEYTSRLYLGVAAQGRSPKVLMLRTYVAILAAAQKHWKSAGGAKAEHNPADPYMTLLGYFNSLRELGGSRRIVEDEVSSRLRNYAGRRRVGEPDGPFADRSIKYDVRELTSRESTSKVSETKRRLALGFNEDDRVDVALATNMISVGLDIVRLGLMVVFGQPKTSAEYIQATSRVGRDPERPGLVVTLLNVHKPRDRSHYERFEAYHASFYRAVEVTSVTPFAPRAIDRGLPAIVVALARQGHAALTGATRALDVEQQLTNLTDVAEALIERVGRVHPGEDEGDVQLLQRSLRGRAMDLIDTWVRTARAQREAGAGLQYGNEEKGKGQALLHDPLEDGLTSEQRKFRAGRSLRDVEPNVNLWMRRLDGITVPEEAAE